MDTKLKELVINEVTEEKLKELEDANAIPPNELFVTEDEDEASGGSSFVVDSELSTESENPVANKVVTKKFNDIEPGVLFAESERQKSKNLFDLSRVKFSSSVNVNLSNNSFTFTAFSTYTINKLKDFADLEVGKTYRLIATSGSNSTIYLSGVSQYWYFNNTITITQEILDSAVGFYGKTNVAVTISEVMITEGTNEESYQPYNGAIVHEKKIAGLKGQVLWENSAPTVEFVAQTVTLNTDNYDYLEIIYRYSTDFDWQQSIFVEKGAQALLQTVNTPNIILARITGIVNGSSLAFEKAFFGQNGNESPLNNYLIPVKIIGYRRS